MFDVEGREGWWCSGPREGEGRQRGEPHGGVRVAARRTAWRLEMAATSLASEEEEGQCGELGKRRGGAAAGGMDERHNNGAAWR